ncbi:MAG: Glycogen phosphorylase [candidate division WS2 bacterium]|nr:Glycogen phosphorylase [Candidatus Psychracetigena formicireducens]
MNIKYNTILKRSRIAYFSMEIGIDTYISTYAGGLGVLAGDTVKTAADLGLPFIAVTLISNKGYFKQQIAPDGNQYELSQEWSPAEKMDLLPISTSVVIEGKEVKVKSWLYSARSVLGHEVPILFLDTNVLDNHVEDREITSYLYGRDRNYRLKQEIVLGIGGVKILKALNLNIEKYHMNEGHSSFLALELLKMNDMNIDKIRDLCVFTTHTPIEAGHDKFDYQMVQNNLGDYLPIDEIKKLGGNDYLNMTLLALNLSNYVNGVAKKHREVTKNMFPGYDIHSITNGIHSYSWSAKSFRALYDKYIPGWIREPELLFKVDLIPDGEIWKAHLDSKRELIDYVNQNHQVQMDYDTFTIGFARRATAYKRANLIFTDLERLKRINKENKIQIIFSGKAHKMDDSGKSIIKEIMQKINNLKEEIAIVYLEDYNLNLAAKMVAGVDLWLNTPQKPLEASGTSGMKAAHNGVVNFSVLDGWWIEGWMEGITGYSIGYHPEVIVTLEESFRKEIEDLYSKLEYIILPMFYYKRYEWIKVMKNSIGKISHYFNSHRMVNRYLIEAYLNNSKNSNYQTIK